MLKATFNEGIPVASLSRCSIASKNDLPDCEIFRSSSNSSLTPFAMAFPLFNATGASAEMVVEIFSRSNSQACKLSPITFSASFLDCKADSFNGIIASKLSFNITNSRGEIFPVASLEINRSKSEICLIWY